MSDFLSNTNNHILNDKYHILSGSALKVIAVITMLIDHTGSVFLSGNPIPLFTVAGHTLTLYTVLRFIGRISFPIFAYLIVEGFLHTSDRKNYGLRLFIFALISEIPWNLEHSGTIWYSGQNVFFTLLLGYLGLCVLERIEKEKLSVNYLLMLLLLMVISVVLRSDYGISGFGFIVMLFILRNNQLYQTVLGACILSSRWKASLAFIPIWLYNGKRGFINTRAKTIAFYLIYPVHMLLFYYIKLKTIGY